MTTVKCPTCGAAVEWSKEQHWKPFCSERCKQIDLGTWAGEGYRISERPGRETNEEPSIRDDESET